MLLLRDYNGLSVGFLDTDWNVLNMEDPNRNSLVRKVLDFISRDEGIMDVEIMSSDDSTIILVKKNSKWGEVIVGNDLLVDFVVYYMGTSVKRDNLTIKSSYHKFEEDYTRGFL